jgi:hypothetical protein
MSISDVESSRRRCSTPSYFEDMPGKWQAAILKAERDRPKLRLVSHDGRDAAGGRET